jgi:C-terminal processing protease CtpA/Prc
MNRDDARRKLVRVKPQGNGFGFTLRFCADDTPGGRSSESIVFIKSVVAKGPASVAGLAPGDRIEAINGLTVNGRSYKEIIAEIKQR